jgi:thiamine-phosphate pyrophosphorylase
MEIALLSTKDKFLSEVNLICELFELGLDSFHIKKPDFSTKEMRTYLGSFPEIYRQRLVLHTHHRLANEFKIKGVHMTKNHLKRHDKKGMFSRFKNLFAVKPHIVSRNIKRVNDLNISDVSYEYIVLSPVFDSISKRGFGGAFSVRTIKDIMINAKCKVYAFGGVSTETIQEAVSLGFEGVLIFGALWKAEDKTAYFKDFMQTLHPTSSPKVAAQQLTPELEELVL